MNRRSAHRLGEEWGGPGHGGPGKACQCLKHKDSRPRGLVDVEWGEGGVKWGGGELDMEGVGCCQAGNV